MNVTPYTLGSLRKLVRDLQAENKELKALLDKSGIPYAKSNVFEESGTAAEEYDGYSCAGVPLFRRNGYRQSSGRKPLFRNRDTALN